MGYKISEELIEKIRDSCDLIDVVSRYVHLKRSGSNYVGLCPFHSEKTPSFTVSSTKKLFHCFGCGVGGDVITFIMKVENLSFTEALKYLADLEGIPIEEDNSIDSKKAIEKQKVYEINREAARYYHYLLGKNIRAINYLKSRDVDLNTVKMFGLGFALDSWDNVFNYLKNKGYSEEDIEKSGLVGRRKDNKCYDKFRNRIIFPIIDIKSRILGFGGRTIGDSKPKYLNSPDTIVFEKGKNLYGLNLVDKYSNREKIILVEGYMDVIALFSQGINYAVASLGTSLTNYQAKLLKRYGNQIYICYDSDQAGIKATIRALNILRQEEIEPKVIILPEQCDPDDYVKKNGIEGFVELENNALNYIDFNIFLLKKKYDLSTPEGKIKFTKEITKILKELKSPIEQDVYIDKIADDLGVSKEAIKREMLGKSYHNPIIVSKDKYINAKKSHTKDIINPIKTVIEPAQLTAEKKLLVLMAKSRSYFDFIKEHLEIDDFQIDACRTFANLIFQEYNNNPILSELDMENIKNKALENSSRLDYSIVSEIISEEIDYSIENINRFIMDLVGTVRYYKLKNEREDISKRIKEIEQKKDLTEQEVEEFRRLCMRLTELDKELKAHV